MAVDHTYFPTKTLTPGVSAPNYRGYEPRVIRLIEPETGLYLCLFGSMFITDMPSEKIDFRASDGLVQAIEEEIMRRDISKSELIRDALWNEVMHARSDDSLDDKDESENIEEHHEQDKYWVDGSDPYDNSLPPA